MPCHHSGTVCLRRVIERHLIFLIPYLDYERKRKFKKKIFTLKRYLSVNISIILGFFLGELMHYVNLVVLLQQNKNLE